MVDKIIIFIFVIINRKIKMGKEMNIQENKTNYPEAYFLFTENLKYKDNFYAINTIDNRQLVSNNKEELWIKFVTEIYKPSNKNTVLKGKTLYKRCYYKS